MFDINQKLHLQEVSSSNIYDISPDMEAEYVSLPSKGFFYKGVYKNITQLKIKKLSWAEEDMLTTESYYQNGTLFNEILKSVVVDKNFPVEDLIDADKNAILWWLRIGAFGVEYEINHTCPSPECKKKFKVIWNLGEVMSPDYPEKYEQEIFENGYVELTLKENKFQLIPSTYHKTLLVDSFIKFKIKPTERAYNITKKLLCSIIKIKDKFGNICKDLDSIHNWLIVNSLSLSDSRAIQKCIKEIDLEIDTKQSIQCKNCGNVEEGVSLPMNIYFFGLNTPKYREHLIKSINYLHFWGKLDYQSCLRMSTAKRRDWASLTEENLKILYPK